MNPITTQLITENSTSISPFFCSYQIQNLTPDSKSQIIEKLSPFASNKIKNYSFQSNSLLTINSILKPSYVINSLLKEYNLVLRGSNDNSAICILSDSVTNKVTGLVRIIHQDDDDDNANSLQNSLLFDITLNSHGRETASDYKVQINTHGDLTQTTHTPSPSSVLCTLLESTKLARDEKETQGLGRSFFVSASNLEYYGIIGRSISFIPIKDDGSADTSRNVQVGIIARSAGAWDNDKMVCSCSGKNLWQEKSDAIEQGIY